MSQIGTIDCGFIADVQVNAAEKWVNPMYRIDYEADVETVKAVLENQRVRMNELLGRKKLTLSVEWPQKCDITTTDCSDDCTITGDDIEPVCKEYEIECLRETSFKVPERAYRERTIEMQEAIAENMLLHKKAMDEWIAQYILAGLLANAGVNAFTGGVGTVAGNTTTIPANFWDNTIWGYFNRVILGNKFKNSYMIDGDNLYQYIFNRQHEAMSEAGKAAMSKMGTIRKIYQDPLNVETYAEGTTFLLHQTAVAFLNKAWNSSKPEPKAGNYWLWSEPSMNLPGIYYDVVMQETCVSNEFYRAFKLQLHGLFAANPGPCDEDNTGILTFECGV